MRRLFVFATVGAVLLLAMGMGAAPIAAQEDPAENATDQDGGDLEDDPDQDDRDDELDENESAAEATDDFLREIDSSTRITDWEYAPGMFTIEIEADAETEVSLTEAGDFEEGTGSFNYAEVDLEEGSNTITFAVTDRSGAGVAIATRRSLEQGTGAFVSVGSVEQNPFRHFGGESGLFSGVIMTTGLAALGAGYVVRSEESGVVEA